MAKEMDLEARRGPRPSVRRKDARQGISITRRRTSDSRKILGLTRASFSPSMGPSKIAVTSCLFLRDPFSIIDRGLDVVAAVAPFVAVRLSIE